MKRFWLDSYAEGVPHDIDMGNYQSIVDFLTESTEQFPDNGAFTNFGTTLSYSEFTALTQQFGAYLQHDLGLKKGDRLAIMLPNVLQYPIALFGALRIGLTIVNVDPMYTVRELTHQLNNSGATTLLFLENFGDVVETTMPKTEIKHVISTQVGDMLKTPERQIINFMIKHVKRMVPKFTISQAVSFRDALKASSKHVCNDTKINLEDIAFLQYTGGTTGVSKGAILTHGNIIANVLQAKSWALGGSNFVAGQERAIAALPIYHIFAMTANVLFFMCQGGENILITNPRDFEGFVKILKKTKFSVIVGVNTLYRKLLNTKGFDEVDFSGIKLTFAGGMPVTDDVANDWQEMTGSTIVEAYGLTETSPAICINPFTLEKFNGKIGLPVSSTYIQIKDDDGNDLGINEPGELCVKGPQVTQGYWKGLDVNDDVFTEDGYFRTGDFTQINEQGYVEILDRKKDMILVSGFNVFPNEIENVVSQHPKILEAAAIGIPNESSGEAVKLFVVTTGVSLTESEIIEYCRENLTAYKCPKEIIFMDELPKSNVGKILRKDLR